MLRHFDPMQLSSTRGWPRVSLRPSLQHVHIHGCVLQQRRCMGLRSTFCEFPASGPPAPLNQKGHRSTNIVHLGVEGIPILVGGTAGNAPTHAPAKKGRDGRALFGPCEQFAVERLNTLHFDALASIHQRRLQMMQEQQQRTVGGESGGEEEEELLTERRTNDATADDGSTTEGVEDEEDTLVMQKRNMDLDDRGRMTYHSSSPNFLMDGSLPPRRMDQFSLMDDCPEQDTCMICRRILQLELRPAMERILLRGKAKDSNTVVDAGGNTATTTVTQEEQEEEEIPEDILDFCLALISLFRLFEGALDTDSSDLRHELLRALVHNAEVKTAKKNKLGGHSPAVPVHLSVLAEGTLCTLRHLRHTAPSVDGTRRTGSNDVLPNLHHHETWYSPYHSAQQHPLHNLMVEGVKVVFQEALILWQTKDTIRVWGSRSMLFAVTRLLILQGKYRRLIPHPTPELERTIDELMMHLFRSLARGLRGAGVRFTFTKDATISKNSQQQIIVNNNTVTKKGSARFAKDRIMDLAKEHDGVFVHCAPFTSDADMRSTADALCAMDFHLLSEPAKAQFRKVCIMFLAQWNGYLSLSEQSTIFRTAMTINLTKIISWSFLHHADDYSQSFAMDERLVRSVTVAAHLVSCALGMGKFHPTPTERATAASSSVNLSCTDPITGNFTSLFTHWSTNRELLALVRRHASAVAYSSMQFKVFPMTLPYFARVYAEASSIIGRLIHEKSSPLTPQRRRDSHLSWASGSDNAPRFVELSRMCRVAAFLSLATFTKVKSDVDFALLNQNQIRRILKAVAGCAAQSGWIGSIFAVLIFHRKNFFRDDVEKRMNEVILEEEEGITSANLRHFSSNDDANRRSNFNNKKTTSMEGTWLLPSHVDGASRAPLSYVLVHATRTIAARVRSSHGSESFREFDEMLFNVQRRRRALVHGESDEHSQTGEDSPPPLLFTTTSLLDDEDKAFWQEAAEALSDMWSLCESLVLPVLLRRVWAAAEVLNPSLGIAAKGRRNQSNNSHTSLLGSSCSTTAMLREEVEREAQLDFAATVAELRELPTLALQRMREEIHWNFLNDLASKRPFFAEGDTDNLPTETLMNSSSNFVLACKVGKQYCRSVYDGLMCLRARELDPTATREEVAKGGCGWGRELQSLLPREILMASRNPEQREITKAHQGVEEEERSEPFDAEEFLCTATAASPPQITTTLRSVDSDSSSYREEEEETRTVVVYRLGDHAVKMFVLIEALQHVLGTAP